MQSRILLAVAAGLISGCAAKTAPVNFSMVSAEGVEAGVDIAVNSVEVKHEEDGWIMVDMAADAGKVGGLEAGNAVTLASSELPKGRYTMVRVKYAATMVDAMAAKAHAQAVKEAEAAAAAQAMAAAEEEEGSPESEKTMTRTDATAPESEKTMTPAEEAEPESEKTLSRPEPVRKDHEAKLEQAFCISEDGALELQVTREEYSLSLAVNAPGC